MHYKYIGPLSCSWPTLNRDQIDSYWPIAMILLLVPLTLHDYNDFFSPLLVGPAVSFALLYLRLASFLFSSCLQPPASEHRGPKSSREMPACL